MVWWRLGVLLGVPKVLLGVHLAVHRVRVQLGVARGLPPRQWCPTVGVTEVVVATTVEGVVGARSSGVGVWGERAGFWSSASPELPGEGRWR